MLHIYTRSFWWEAPCLSCHEDIQSEHSSEAHMECSAWIKPNSKFIWSLTLSVKSNNRMSKSPTKSPFWLQVFPSTAQINCFSFHGIMRAGKREAQRQRQEGYPVKSLKQHNRESIGIFFLMIQGVRNRWNHWWFTVGRPSSQGPWHHHTPFTKPKRLACPWE